MTASLVDQPEFARRSIFALAADIVSSGGKLTMFLFVASILATTIFATNVIWVITGSDPTVLSGLLQTSLSLQAWLAIFSGYLALAFVVGRLRGNRPLSMLVLMIGAWLAGTYGIRALEPFIPYAQADFPLQDYQDFWAIFTYRLSFVAPLIPMLALYFLLEKGDRSYPLRFGDMSRTTSVFRNFRPGRRQFSWRTWLLLIVLFFSLPAFFVFQMQVDFEPLTSGKWLLFLIPILLLALLNAFSEDVLFQGFLLPNEAKLLGGGAAILLHALFFGFFHFGSAPNAIAGLLPALIITALVWIAAKGVLETRGLGITILIHMSIDIVIFSAVFI